MTHARATGFTIRPHDRFSVFEFADQPVLADRRHRHLPFNKVEELEMASQLFEIADEAELDLFLGKLIKKAWRGIRKVASGVLRPLGKVLKSVAKRALPFLGGALGSLIPIPGVGTAIGKALGSAVSKALEVELESSLPEDREFELARRFVQLGGIAARQAATQAPATRPLAVAEAAVLAAARQLASQAGHNPGLLAIATARPQRQSGRWIRRGNSIILLGMNR